MSQDLAWFKSREDAIRRACPSCNHKPNPELWECSKVDCPNRKQVTAQPSDRPTGPTE